MSALRVNYSIASLMSHDAIHALHHVVKEEAVRASDNLCKVVVLVEATVDQPRHLWFFVAYLDGDKICIMQSSSSA